MKEGRLRALSLKTGVEFASLDFGNIVNNIMGPKMQMLELSMITFRLKP